MKHIYILTIALIISLLLNGTVFSQWVHVSVLGGGGTKSLAVNGSNLFAGTEMGVYLSTDNGDNWTAVNNNLPETLIWFMNVYGNNIYACTGGVGFFRTTDNGASWDNLSLIGENIRACAENDSGIFAGTNDDGVYRSTDDGSTWVQVNNGLNNPTIWSLCINGSAIFAGGTLLYRSMDNGENWVSLTSGLPNPPLNVNAFTKINSDIYISIGGGIYSTTDNGDSWNNLGLNGMNVEEIYSYGTNLFAGVSGTGVYLSTDNGSNWELVSEGLPSPIYPQSFVTSGDKIFLAAWYEGLFWRPLSELVSSVEDFNNIVPTNFNLYQNYPNPFNPTTKIKYSVPQTSQVQIKVYDVLGNEIETLVSEEKSAGTYELIWYAVNLPSGIYFYQLIAGSFVQTKKMILLK
jgi:photosystem II stability/assembly factor-like uncharacterized protein